MKRAKKPKKKPVTMTTTQIEKLKDEVRRVSRTAFNTDERYSKHNRKEHGS